MLSLCFLEIKHIIMLLILCENSAARPDFYTVSLIPVSLSNLPTLNMFMVFFSLSCLPEGNKHFTTITVFSCTCLEDMCRAIAVNSFSLGSHITRKWGRMWLLLPECSFHLLSLSPPSLPVLQFCSNPACEWASRNKNRLLQPRGKTFCKERQFHICGHKMIKLSAAVAHCAVLTQAVPLLYFDLSVFHLLHPSWTSDENTFLLVVLVKRD